MTNQISNNMNLIGKSKEIFSQLNIKELQEAGIEREDIKKSSHSHIIVTYPPYSALPPIDAKKIYFSNSKESSKREMAFYWHLPFCTGKCLYCPYRTFAKQPTIVVDKYIDAIEKEIFLLLKSPILQNVELNSIYLGGGTPTYLSAQQLNRVFAIIRNNFNVKKNAEITVEAEPDTILAIDGKEKLKTLHDNGVTRLSIGFQTFNDKTLKFIGRRHTSKQAIAAYRLAKKCGFKNINIDLITGLPDQTFEIWEDDLKQVMKLKPVSVTCYSFALKTTAGIWPFYQREPERFPNKESVIIMHIMTAEFFKKYKYIQRPLRWFVKAPKYMYHQQLFKWEQIGEQLAVGLSSYSFVNDYQYFNNCVLTDYLDKIKNGDLPIERGSKLTNEDLMRRLIIFGLKSRLDKKVFYSKFGKMPKDVFKETWKKLENLGLIEENKETIQLTYKGKLFADEVSKEFYSEKVKEIIKD
jgi:oxygen-independent coproporphyrinogen-3 oxidase